MAVVGEIKTNPNNPNQKARWNGKVWEPVGASVGPKAAPAWGPGAVELPDTSVVRYGPQGGITVLKKASAGQGNIDDPIVMTEDQGKAQVQARLMANAETNYQKARREGYDPANLPNSFASFVEGAPFGVLDGLGTLVRDDVSDRGRQAELQYSDAQLKAMSGAAAPEGEVKRNVKILFPRPGENINQIEAQKQAARLEAFRGAKLRSGPAAPTLPIYPGEPGFSKDKPIDISKRYTREAVARLPVGAHYRDAAGNIRKNVNGPTFLSDPEAGNPIVVPARAPAKTAPQPGKRLRYNPETGEIE